MVEPFFYTDQLDHADLLCFRLFAPIQTMSIPLSVAGD